MVRFVIDPSVHDVDLTEHYPYVSWHGHFEYFKKTAGIEHYKLIAHLAKQLPENSVVADIGTFGGHSAVALATNPTASVVTYDVVDHFELLRESHVGEKTILDHPRIEFRVRNCLDADQLAFLKDLPLIVLDVDPHGSQERDILAALKSVGYRGIVICDDIQMNQDMRSFWATGIPEGVSKINVTKFGHWSGTGILVFDADAHSVVVAMQSRPPRPPAQVRM